MKINRGLRTFHSIKISKKYATYLLVLILLIVITVIIISTTVKETPLIAIRIDDIQDYAYRDAQLHLINYGIVHHIPLSLAVITGFFGSDEEIVQTVKLAAKFGAEMTVHGWEHENISSLSFEEQCEVLRKAKNALFETTGYNSSIFVPPMFEFNDNTLRALDRQGYRILSTSIELLEPGYYSGIENIPGLVELSDFANNQWEMKSIDNLEKEIEYNVNKYSFAVIVTHPQEFVINGSLDVKNIEYFERFLEIMMQKYKIASIDEISKNSSFSQ